MQPLREVLHERRFSGTFRTADGSAEVHLGQPGHEARPGGLQRLVPDSVDALCTKGILAGNARHAAVFSNPCIVSRRITAMSTIASPAPTSTRAVIPSAPYPPSVAARIVGK